MQIRSAAKWIATAAGILAGAIIVGFTLKDTTYIEAKLEQIKGASQSVTAVEKTTAKVQKIKKAETVKETPLPESSSISDFAFTGQMPELPTGCEITSLTMVLNYYGYSADKMTMALEYLPTLGWTNTYYGEDGNLYGNDIYDYFIGNPQSETDGLSCGAGAITTAADSYLADNGNAMKAEDETGSEPEQLYRFVSEGTPVVVWGTIGMEERQEMESWNTEDGREGSWAMNDHCVVLIGYSADSVTVADPIEGIVSYDRAQFESAFRSRGNQCVILKNVQ